MPHWIDITSVAAHAEHGICIMVHKHCSKGTLFHIGLCQTLAFDSSEPGLMYACICITVIELQLHINSLN